MNIKTKILFATIMASLSLAASAQSTGFYAGASLGESHTKFDSEFDLAGYTSSTDNNHTAWKLFVGYDFNSYLAVEAGYTDLGTAKYTWFNATGSGQQRRESTATFIAVKGNYPVNDKIDLFAKLGATSNRVTLTYDEVYSGVYRSTTASNTRTDMLIGVGAEYRLVKNIGVRVEYERYGTFGTSFDSIDGTGRTKTELWSAGATYKF